MASPGLTYLIALTYLRGGAPCQPCPLGGLARAALDERDMFPAYVSILNRLRPRAFIIENVKGLTQPSFSDYYSYMLPRLQRPGVASCENENWRSHAARLAREHTSGIHDELRYEVLPTVIDAADYGVPQHRHRVFIVGFRSDVTADWSFPSPTHSGEALRRAQVSGEYWERNEVPLSERRTPQVPASGDSELLLWRTVRDALFGLPDPRSSESAKWLNHELQLGARVPRSCGTSSRMRHDRKGS